MKKPLLILLCLPIIGFGQDDCGKEPKNPNKFNNSSTNNSPKYREYKKELAVWEKCIAERMAQQGPVKADSKLGNKWIYDNNLYYEIIYNEDINIKDGKIKILLTKDNVFPLNKSSYLEGATIKVQKKDGRTRVLVYDFEMGSDKNGGAFGTTTSGISMAFGSSTEQTYNFTDIVFNRDKHSYKRWIKHKSLETVERGIIEAIENKAGVSKELLNDEW
jgi:hypothetical protein